MTILKTSLNFNACHWISMHEVKTCFSNFQTASSVVIIWSYLAYIFNYTFLSRALRSQGQPFVKPELDLGLSEMLLPQFRILCPFGAISAISILWKHSNRTATNTFLYLSRLATCDEHLGLNKLFNCLTWVNLNKAIIIITIIIT